MSQSQGADPIAESCSLTGHGALLVGDLLYVQGGRMIYNWMDGWGGYGQNPYLRVLNLTETVRLQDVPDNIITVESNTAPFRYDIETIQDTRLPMFWLDQTAKKAYLAGGARIDIANRTYIGGRDWNPGKVGKMWTANVGDNNILSGWTEVDMKIGNRNANLIGAGANWFDPDTRTGYIFGGSYLDYTEIDFAVNQLVTFNAATGEWKNTSTPFQQTSSGFLHGLELDGRTVLLAGLGVTNGQEGTVDTVRVYDTNSTQWYSQRTNGALPANRFWSTCSVIVAAQDKSSYQIIVYGGADSETTYGDVWALSIPSFTWSKLSDDTTSSVAAGARYAASCTLAKNHNMVVFGGNRVLDAYTYAFPDCDKNNRLAYFFDLNLQEWTSQILGDEPDIYRVPQAVYDVIGGNAEGGATLTAPPGGFNQAGMSTVFAAFATTPTSTTTGAITSVATTEASSGSKKVSGGAIGGIVVGVIAILALVGVGVWFLLRKRRQSRELATPLPPPPPAPPSEDKLFNAGGYPMELRGSEAYHNAVRMELHGDPSALKVELPGSIPAVSEVPSVRSPVAPSQGPHEVGV
ncbi:hypothetical protein H072_1744 [Dactylellina haptotyla CBS 200.50]|uniref:Kelch repeat protein n=1 Tax=Dactylellina haptotyla (strain CBS 200.50) TaxID=1284197 RepID=S8C970_DACHA|nr:hypothetical protein H072_1744 [Dactylellina haptotyla CBS 200.50]